ncbi:MAG: hypothetical protein AMXMBFR64_16230 [Myxococcales bacterium]
MRIWVAVAVMVVFGACKGTPPPAKKDAPPPAPVAAPEAAPTPAPSTPGEQSVDPALVAAQAAKEIVFDPANPPAGYFNCHRNHCHHQDGRVASYAQIMAEMGATRMVGGVVPKEAPPAPADVAAPPADAERTPSGLASKVLTPGSGQRKPGPTSLVRVHYTGWTTDGRSFDSSVSRGQPAQFPLNRVIAGWTEGLQLMVEGEERRFWIPENLAYAGQAGRPQGMLVFDVELIAIVQ